MGLGGWGGGEDLGGAGVGEKHGQIHGKEIKIN